MGKLSSPRKSFRSTIRSHIQNVDSHIDNVRNSLERLVFTSEKEVEKTLLKKRIKVVAIVTVLLMVLGSFISPKSNAEVATFYPTSCLGGWVNPNNAEGEPQVKSNTNEDDFTKENSAILANTTNAEIYCGGFSGEIKENTKPTKIIVTLSWGKGKDIILEQNITAESFASSSKDILDTSSTTNISFTLSSSTESTTTIITDTDSITTSTSSPADTSTNEDPSLIDNVIESIANFFGNNKEESTTTPEVVPESLPEIPIETAPSTEEASSTNESAPTSFLENVTRTITSYFIKSVFAEEISSTTDTTTVTQTTNIVETSVIDTPITVPETSENNTETVAPTLPETLPEISNENISQEEDTTVSLSTTTEENSSTSTTTSSTSTVPILGTTTEVVSESNDEDQSPNNFLEILYSFDGATWKSLGKVNENSMRYRTFEIPVTATTSWGDLRQLQIKVQKLQRVDNTPTVYLDGVRVDVLYETPVIHEHPDFARDIVLRDMSDDNVRVINLINSDTNNVEIWYTTIYEQGQYGVAPGSWVQLKLSQNDISYKLIQIYGENIFGVDDSSKMLWASNLEKGTSDGMAMVGNGSTTVTFIKSNGEEWVFEYNSLTKVGIAKIKN